MWTTRQGLSLMIPIEWSSSVLRSKYFITYTMHAFSSQNAYACACAFCS